MTHLFIWLENQHTEHLCPVYPILHDPVPSLLDYISIRATEIVCKNEACCSCLHNPPVGVGYGVRRPPAALLLFLQKETPEVLHQPMQQCMCNRNDVDIVVIRVRQVLVHQGGPMGAGFVGVPITHIHSATPKHLHTTTSCGYKDLSM
jgi:hypothetical protein